MPRSVLPLVPKPALPASGPPPPPRRWIGWLRRIYLTLRTEHTTPSKLGAAVGIGVFIGCSPFWGIHLGLCVLLATLFRLNRVLVYAAANLSNPLTAPLLIFAEVQVGHRLLRGEWLGLTMAEFVGAGFSGIVLDFVVGGLLVGGVLGAVLGLVTWLVSRASRSPAMDRDVVDAIVRRYLDVSIRDAEAARTRLLRDPIYPFLLTEPAFATARRILDLGCGRGLAAAVAASRRELLTAERSYVGVDVSRRYVRVAREALADLRGHAFLEADLRDFDPPDADLVLLSNVLRFLPASSQDALLRRLGRVLHPGARLYVREVEARPGLRFFLTRTKDLFASLLPGRARQRIDYRRSADLRNALTAAGFEVRDRTTLHTAPRARILLEAVRGPVGTGRRFSDLA